MKKLLKTSLAGFCRVLLVVLLALPLAAHAQQQKKVTGTVIDENSEPMIGVTILVSGTSIGTATDFDGNFTISVPSSAKTIEFSYVGYEKQTVAISSSPMRVQMVSDNALQEVVVIGYGTQKKTDLTGAVSTIGVKDFNQGVIASPEQLVNGKISGVQIMNDGGSTSAGATIRIRGGASLSASNDPLIVIDGVPMETGKVGGSGNPLSLINPADIETMTVLKDASSTAIYGSRASNGVIIITTKKGGKDSRPKFTFTTTNSWQVRAKNVDMMSYEQMLDAVSKNGTAKQKGVAGLLNSDDADYAEAKAWHDQVYSTGTTGSLTDWKNSIYQTGVGTDNNLSMSGCIAGFMPYRVSLGYMHRTGIVENDWSQRGTVNINLSPSFLDDHLKFNLNVKGTTNDTRYANTGAIWNALTMNPYMPAYNNNGSYMGYFESVNSEGKLVNGAMRNPIGLVENKLNKANTKRFIGNADIDYKLHCLPELRLHVTGGYDYAHGKGLAYIPAEAAEAFESNGSSYEWGPQKNYNRLLTIYANYHKEIEGRLPQTIDLTAGYDYQYWKQTTPLYYSYDAAGTTVQGTTAATDQRHTLLSYYGRLNYTLLDRYMLTATIRRDGSSRFADGKKWGSFPSVAVAYNMAREKFFEPLSSTINDLKLRASYGVTGQQEVSGNYNFLSTYTPSTLGAYYMLGGQPYVTYRPSSYNSDLTWETTKAFNVGIDLGFLNNRFTASVDYYHRKTQDLLATVPVAAGTNFSKEMLRNVGNISSQGVELSFNANIISTPDWQWNVSGNATWQKVRIDNLRASDKAQEVNTPQGWVDSHYVQVFTEGYAPYSFYVYKQVYDEKTGKPIEGMYADLNADGKIDNEDRYHYHSPTPDWIFGLSTSLTWKRLTLSTSLRANVGNYVYNQIAMNTGAWETVYYNDYQMNLMNTSYLGTGFKTRQYESDYYVENASFIKMDNLSIGYNFGQLSRYVSMNASFMVQNVFTITKYSGLDPEVSGGIDGSSYPRPRTYSFTVGLEF